MPTDWAEYELHDPPQTNAVDWSAYEPHEEPVKRNALGESKEDLQRKMEAARSEGALGEFGSNAITALQNTAEIAKNPIGAATRAIAPLYNRLAGAPVASEFKGVDFSGITDPALQMVEEGLHLPGGALRSPESLTHGIAQSAEQTAGGFTEPETATMLPLFGPGARVASPALTQAGRALIAAQMAKQVPEALRQASEVIADPNSTPAEKAKAGTDAFTAYALATGAAHTLAPTLPTTAIPDNRGASLNMPEGARPPAPEVIPPTEVPATPPEPQRTMTVLEEIRAMDARTKEDVRKLFPHLSREEAGKLRDQAFPEDRFERRLVETSPKPKPLTEEEQNALSERISKTLSLEVPPASGEAVGARVPGAEEPALPQEQAIPPASSPETSGALKENLPVRSEAEIDAELDQLVPKDSPLETFHNATLDFAKKMPTTEDSWKAGMQTKTVADLEALAALRDKIKTDKNKFARLRVQVPGEAIMAATNLGSAAEGNGTVPIKLGPRPLDWRTHPEVQDWLRKNADRAGITLPEDFPTAKPTELTAAERAAENAAIQEGAPEEPPIEGRGAAGGNIGMNALFDPANYKPQIEFAKHVFSKAKDFAAWSGEMISKFGESIKQHLQDIWDHVRGVEKAPRTADEILASKPGSTPYESISALSDADAAKIFDAKKPEGGAVITPQYDSVIAGMKLSEADVPALEKLRDAEGKKMMEAFKNNDPIGQKAAFGKNIWFSGAIEGAKRKGGNYEATAKRLQEKAQTPGLKLQVGNRALEGGFVQIPGVTTLTEGVKSLGEGIRALADQIINPEKRDAISRYFQGHSAPKTMAASEASGNALARYAAAQDAAPFIAKSMALDVLGKNAKNEGFRKRLGAVLVEDRLRAIRQKFIDAANKATSLPEKAQLIAKANKVTTLVGSGKEFATNGDFLNAIKDPEIAAAIDQHKKTVQVEAQKFHEETGGELAGPGLHTGAFVNLEALTDETPLNFGTGGRGDYTKPLKRKSVFSREAQGIGKNYELDYNRLAERMIRGNYDEFTKRQMYDQLVKDGLAQILPANESAPEIGGQKAQKFPIQRKVVVANGKTIPQYENLWVRHDLASEVESAFNLGSMVKNTNLAHIGRVLNRLQLAGPTDAVWHMANILSSISGKQGGKNILIDIARKLPGVNVIDAGVRLAAKAREVIAQNPDIVRDLSELSKIGAARPEHLESGFNSRFIKVLDKSARLIRNDMFDNLAERGVITDTSEGARREFVNQVGQYNPRLAGVYQRIFKESGLSPFIVAGRNFNRMGMKAVTLSPGYKAANMAEAIKGRAIEGLGVVATLVAVPTLFNTLLTGQPNGRPGTQFGQIDTGKDDAKGNHIVVDPAQWVGLRRGMRITGINALINGMRSHKPGSEIKQDVGRDMIGAITHPWMGPTAQAPIIAATGKTTSGFTESENPKDYSKNVKAAVQNINPILHAFWNKNDNTLSGSGGEAVKSLTGAVGVKTAANLSPANAMLNRAKSWGLSSDNPKIKAAFEQREKEDFGESKYKPLATALRENNQADAVTEINKILTQSTSPEDRAKAKKLILRRFDPFTTVKGEIRPKIFLTPSGDMEKMYKRTMSAEDRDLYQQAIRDKIATYRALTAAIYGAPRNPPLLQQSGFK